MSTTTATTNTSLSPPTSTQQPPGQKYIPPLSFTTDHELIGLAYTSSPPQSSSLYLFTFLATLLLLLAVSCAIVIRSFILRRRFRRRIEEAIAAGVLIPGALDDHGSVIGRRRRDFGEKPKLWEVWVDEHGHVYDDAQENGSMKASFGKGEGKWDEILPVSATILSSNAPKPIPLPGSDSAASLPSEHQAPRQLFISRLLGRQPFRRDYPATSTPLTQSPPPSQNASEPQLATYPPSISAKDPDPEDEKLQVSVLISMPNPNYRRPYGSDIGGPVSMKGKERGQGTDDGDTEGEIPDVVFGVTEVGFRS